MSTWRESELPDTQRVYRALRTRNPQNAEQLADASGVSGEALEAAIRWLEEQEIVECGRGTGGAYSFSAVRLAK